MRSIDVLRAEHDGIGVMLQVLEAICRRLEAHEPLDGGELEAILGFLKVFVDRCHHGKEEELLFPALEAAGIPREGGPIGVMLSEHEQGRGLIRSMREALEGPDGSGFAATARSYIDLLRAHIAKEDSVLFVAAESILASNQDSALFEGFEAIERERIGIGKHEEFHALLGALSAKYL